MANDTLIEVTCGSNAMVAITRTKELTFRQEYAPNLYTRINLGRCTKQRIQQIQDNLERLKIHAIED
jgi:hypothetical protein